LIPTGLGIVFPKPARIISLLMMIVVRMVLLMMVVIMVIDIIASRCCVRYASRCTAVAAWETSPNGNSGGTNDHGGG
jgi:hypothetical protein